MIDIEKIKDENLYNVKETCELIGIGSSRYLYKISEDAKIKITKNGKFNFYKGSEIKKLIKKRLKDK
jgi:hypothetical protein